MLRDVVLCTMIGTGSEVVPSSFVNQTLDWIEWHAKMADGVVFYMDNVPTRIGAELKSRSPVPVEIVRDTEKWFKATVVAPWPRQSLRFARCAKRLKRKAKWVGFIDTDEFVYPRVGFREALLAQPDEIDWAYLTWETMCGVGAQHSIGTGVFPLRYGQSGKSFIRPEFFRDSSHIGKPLVTNGVISRKSNSVHRWVPLPGVYNVSKRMVAYSQSPHSIVCGSQEVGRKPCQSVSDTFSLRHVRTERVYRRAECT